MGMLELHITMHSQVSRCGCGYPHAPFGGLSEYVRGVNPNNHYHPRGNADDGEGGMSTDIKPGAPTGPMRLPASYRRDGADKPPQANSGARRVNTRNFRKTKSDKIPRYYYEF